MLAFYVTYFIGNQMVKRTVLGSSDSAVIRMVMREDVRVSDIRVQVVNPVLRNQKRS